MDDITIPDSEKKVGGLDRDYFIDNWKGTGLKIGFMALAETDWLTIMSPDVEELFYENFIDCAKKKCTEFR